MMKHTNRILTLAMLLAAVLLCSSCDKEAAHRRKMERMIDRAFANAVEQYAPLADSMLANRPKRLPHSIKPDGTLADVPASSWLSGFFPGSLWYIYENTGDKRFEEYAEKFTSYLKSQQHNRSTHDIGFMVYCSYGNAHRLVPSDEKAEVLVNAATALSTRYNPTVGCIRSWDKEVKPGWHYPVIIDNMMNLELLLWAYEHTQDSLYLNVAMGHADTTMKNHFRENASSYHVVNYDAKTGEPIFRGTFQGLADDSSWARGQGWGLYGYTVMYRFTKEERYLNHARRIADYIISNPTTPADAVPYWDYFAPNEPTTPRDASAAALTASALIELSHYVEAEEAERFVAYAERQLISLSSEEYTAEVGTNCRMLLKHSVTSFPMNREVDVPLSYADYYYLEALTRYKALLAEQKAQ